MQDKLYIVLAYALVGIVIASWPLCAAGMGAAASTKMVPGSRPLAVTLWKILALLIVTLAAMAITGESVTSPLVLIFCLVALGSAISAGRVDVIAVLAAFVALCMSATLLWWGTTSLSFYAFTFFFLVTSAIMRVFTSQAAVRGGGSPIIWITAYSCFAAWLIFSTGIYHDNFSFSMLWHHTGAYVGPAELLLSGAAIFHDFPAQYGLGPTVLIAGLCVKDCWHTMYFVAGFFTLAYSILIAVLAFALTRNRWPERFAVLILCLVVTLIWSGYPPQLSSPMTTPSVSGLRFLPSALLLAYLFFAKDIEHSRKKVLVAQGLWMFGVLWSPESAFYVTFMWWPYYLFIRRAQGDLFMRVKGAVKASIRLLVSAVLLVIVFDGSYWLIYKEQPTLYGIFAYAINPPGPMPINWHGAVWYFLLAIAAALGTLWCLWCRTGDTPALRRSFLLILLSYGVSSYFFLGRSHDNNLLNLLPLYLLVLFSALPDVGNGILSRTRITLAATLIGWLPLFGWHAWYENLIHEGVFQFDSHISDRFLPPLDVRQAVGYISEHYGEPVTLLDGSFDLLHSTQPDPWSAIHAPEDFKFMPSNRRREFLSRTAASLKRTGWVVIDHAFPADEWLSDFDFAYRRVAHLEFGHYYAIRYSPKGPVEVERPIPNQ